MPDFWDWASRPENQDKRYEHRPTDHSKSERTQSWCPLRRSIVSFSTATLCHNFTLAGTACILQVKAAI